jgi:hypothetical protein
MGLECGRGRSPASDDFWVSNRYHDLPPFISRIAHVDGDSVRRAYARADFWDERVRMMAWWADRCNEMQAGGIVVSLRA